MSLQPARCFKQTLDSNKIIKIKCFHGDVFPFEIDIQDVATNNLGNFAFTDHKEENLSFTTAKYLDSIVQFSVSVNLSDGKTYQEFTFKVKFSNNVESSIIFQVYKQTEGD